MKFAVFGDIHGRITLMYVLVSLLKQYENISVDAILQVGDFGAFPDSSRLDRATKKHAASDSDELGFQQYCKPTAESRKILTAPYVPDTYFIRGNHEDFDYLGEYTSPVSIDPWDKICFVPDGRSVEIENVLTPDDTIVVGAFGGIEPKYTERGRGKKARKEHRRLKHSIPDDPRYFDESLAAKCFPNTQIDILLTHNAPYTEQTSYGSAALTRMTDRIKPRVHLFGHHHDRVDAFQTSELSLLAGLDHLEFDRNHQLRDGAWGILTIDKEQTEFIFCDSEHFEWLHDINRQNYRHYI